MTRVKICGLTRKEDVDVAVECGTDAVGFIFGYRGSPRNLPFEKLAKLAGEVPPFVNVVVVSPFSNPELTRVIERIKPSFLQLSYQNDFEGRTSFAETLGKPGNFSNIIGTVHLPNGENQNKDSIVHQCENISQACRAILLDSALIKKSGEMGSVITSGGTGTTHDWKVSRQVRDALFPFPVILAGGLNEENVRKAIQEVKPFAVDVSSGVETKPGIKDKIKMKRFIENAKVA